MDSFRSFISYFPFLPFILLWEHFVELLSSNQSSFKVQLTNHGVSEELMSDVLTMGAEFFNLPEKDKARYYSETSQSPEVTSIEYADEKVHFWRENFGHPCHPLEDYIQHWPENPTRYREVVGRFSVEVRRLSLQLLNLICEGLGLEQGYFEGRLSHGHIFSINHYPLCPDPTSVLGLPGHADPFLITLLNQGRLPGLQVLKDREWLGIEPLPNAFVVNINHMLQVISNGKLKSAYHRVVKNSQAARTTVVSFIHPSSDCLIEPAKSLVNEHNPALYKSFKFGDFLKTKLLATCEGPFHIERCHTQAFQAFTRIKACLLAYHITLGYIRRAPSPPNLPQQMHFQMDLAVSLEVGLLPQTEGSQIIIPFPEQNLHEQANNHQAVFTGSQT